MFCCTYYMLGAQNLALNLTPVGSSLLLYQELDAGDNRFCSDYTCVFHEILVVLFYVHEGCGRSPEEDWLHDVVRQAGRPVDLVDVLLQEVNAKLLQSRHAFESRPRKAEKKRDKESFLKMPDVRKSRI